MSAVGPAKASALKNLDVILSLQAGRKMGCSKLPDLIELEGKLRDTGKLLHALKVLFMLKIEGNLPAAEDIDFADYPE